LIYIEPQSKDAAFHFSVEEYLMDSLQTDEPVLMIWQTEKTVMVGSNQVAQAEVNERVVKDNDVQIVRRRSGGGTIFTDLGTLLYTVILPFDHSTDTNAIIKQDVGGPIVDALIDMGIPAALEGRNDILVDGRKVSGLAQFIKGNRICSHASLLYDADLTLLAEVLNVDEDKIQSKAIRSVRSRVTNLKEYMSEPVTVNVFWDELKRRLFAANEVREYALTETEEQAVRAIRSERYDTHGWTYGRAPAYSLKNSRRYAGGKAEVYLSVKQGVIEHCNIRGDFLGLSPIRNLESMIEGTDYEAAAVEKTLRAVGDDLPLYLGSVTGGELLDCMFA
jgi:lipoate-protein ligase A